MGLVPKVKNSCFCCTLKTGSFVTACFLLVGSSVQTGYYAYLVGLEVPQKMCTAVETVLVREEGKSYPSYENDTYNDPLDVKTVPVKEDRKSYPSYDYDIYNDTLDGKPTTPPRRRYNPRRRFGWGGFWGQRRPSSYLVTKSYLRPCPRDNADNHFWDIDLRAPFYKSILYFMVGILAAMMAGTMWLMAAVYKESAAMVMAWLVYESLLLTVATTCTVVTSPAMFRTVPVHISIVTLLSMALNLAINIYFIIVVANYHRQLTSNKDDDDDDDYELQVEQVTV